MKLQIENRGRVREADIVIQKITVMVRTNETENAAPTS